MIKKVRRKFLMSAMAAMTFCVVLLIGSINLINYRQVKAQIDRVFEEMTAVDQDIHEKKELRDQEHQRMVDKPSDFMKGDRHPVERLYKSRYFTIRIQREKPKWEDAGTGAGMPDEVSAAAETITNTEESFSEEENQALAALILQADAADRSLTDYKYQIIETDHETIIHLLDCSAENKAIRTLLLISILIGLSGLLLIFSFVWYMSGKAVAPLQESLDKQKQFITDASHELKTPVSVISTNMEILKMDLGSENEWVASTQRQIVKLRKLIAHLIALTKLEESTEEIQRTELSLSDAVQDCVEVYATMAETEGKRLHTEVADHIRIYAEENSIREMFTVLFENAVKYSLDDSEIWVRLFQDGKKACFSIENEWEQDVDEQELEKLFERFYRGDKSRSRDQKNSGYGLGLSIARTAAERNKGKLSVAQTKEGRLKFTALF